jgi:hypothetical protein
MPEPKFTVELFHPHNCTDVIKVHELLNLFYEHKFSLFHSVWFITCNSQFYECEGQCAN